MGVPPRGGGSPPHVEPVRLCVGSVLIAGGTEGRGAAHTGEDQFSLTGATGAKALERVPLGSELGGGGSGEVHRWLVAWGSVARGRGGCPLSPTLAIVAGVAPPVPLVAAGVVVVGGHAVVMLAVIVTPLVSGGEVATVSEGGGCHGLVGFV